MSNPLLVDSGTGLTPTGRNGFAQTGFVGLLQVLELAASAYSAHFRLE